jgi:hypothetical protein
LITVILSYKMSTKNYKGVARVRRIPPSLVDTIVFFIGSGGGYCIFSLVEDLYLLYTTMIPNCCVHH